MRMWMVDPQSMCKNHLLGEHRELHTFLGTLKKKISIKGYIDHNCLEPLSIQSRHDELVKEMKRRGWNHNKDIIIDPGLFNHLTDSEKNYKIDTELSSNELYGRCDKCKKI